ncbi:MAG: cysteine-rich CWC family protein [Brachymonas sp.]
MSSTLCPLCGHPNQCAMASGQDAATCWCMQRPAPDAARLSAALPAGTPRS